MGHFLQCHTTQKHCLLFIALGHAHKHMCTQTVQCKLKGTKNNEQIVINNKDLRGLRGWRNILSVSGFTVHMWDWLWV